MSREDELGRQQEKWLARYTDKRVKSFLNILESARVDLQQVISTPESFNAVRVNSIISQIDDIERQISREIRTEPNASQDIAPVTQRNLEDMLKTVAPEAGTVNVSIGALNTETLYRFSTVELNHVSKLFAANLDTIRSVLYSQVGIRGRNPSQVAKELAGREGVFKNQYPRIETILRTETSTVYNTQSLSGIEYANSNYNLSLNKRIVETIDTKRNHPISQILNNQVKPMGEPFKASVSEVAGNARAMKKSVSGIFWPIKNGFYEGERLPAHFRERGVVVPTKKEPTP